MEQEVQEASKIFKTMSCLLLLLKFEHYVFVSSPLSKWGFSFNENYRANFKLPIHLLAQIAAYYVKSPFVTRY